MTFNQVLLRARQFGCGLISLGLRPHELVGIYCQNRPEWTIFEQGAYCYSLVVVALYDTLGPDACAFIINQTDMSTVIVEDDKKANMLLDKAPHGLRRLITINCIRSETMQRARNRGVDCILFVDVRFILYQKNSRFSPFVTKDVTRMDGRTDGHKNRELVMSVCPSGIPMDRFLSV